MALLLLIFAYGDIFKERPPLTLDESGGFIPIKIVEPMSDKWIVVGLDDHGNYLHLYDKGGKRLTSFGAHGQGPGMVGILGWPTWHTARNQLWVYDVQRNHFLLFDENGTFIKTIDLPDGVYLEQYGKHLSFDGGFFLLLDAYDGQWNLGRFDHDFRNPVFGFRMSDTRARTLSDPIFTPDAALLTFEGKQVIVAVENLAPMVHVLDLDLAEIRRFSVGTADWQEADLDMLSGLDSYQVTSGDYRETYSEIRSIRALENGYFVVVYRNPQSDFQTEIRCFHVEGQKIGDALESKLEFVGGHGNVLLLIDPETDDMTLYPFEVTPTD